MRETTRTTILLLAAMGAGYIGGLLSQATHRAVAQTAQVQPTIQDVVCTKQLELMDNNGKLRGEFAMSDTGPALFLFDAMGKTRGSFALAETGPALYLADAVGKPRGVFALTETGPALSLADAAGVTRGQFGLNESGPAIGLVDAAGKKRGLFGLSDIGPGLYLGDSDGKPRGEFSLVSTGPSAGPALYLRSKIGGMNGSGAFALYDTIGMPGLVIDNTAGQPIWGTPMP